MSLDDAYLVQDALLAARFFRGDSLAGAKLGLTSKAKQQQMGVDEPGYGWVRVRRCSRAPTPTS
jgi:2-oxo-3-hexenedioate decarboxylase